ncbi:hypothetical protein L4C44_22425 [Vibrio satsumensis]|uniref:hypothetical protein n=1 Tax=Vibrio TaxID=662 RepID=UPI0016454913|nr:MULTISPECIES: hypothetical protein [Vibrio]MEC7310139.1 hypothetical protein [Vibrio crassostreae]
MNFTFHDICIGNNPDGFRQNLPLMGNILPDGVQKITIKECVAKLQVLKSRLNKVGF